MFKVVLCTLFQKLNLYLKTELFTLEHIIKPKAGHTYTVASAPAVTGSFFYAEIHIIFGTQQIIIDDVIKVKENTACRDSSVRQLT